MNPSKKYYPRPLSKVVVVSDDTHAKLKAYALKHGLKTQSVADMAVLEYLQRQEVTK